MLRKRLRAERERLGLSAREVDRRAKLTLGHTSAIESGAKDDVTTHTALALAKVLGVNVEFLISGTGPRLPKKTGTEG